MSVPGENSPEYREAIIDAVNEALKTTPWHATISDPLMSGRLVGALLKRGLRIYPLRERDTDWTCCAACHEWHPPAPQGDYATRPLPMRGIGGVRL